MSLVGTNNLSHNLSAQTGVAEEDVAKFLQSFASVIADHVSKGEDVEILGLGKFTVIDTSQTSMRRVALMMSDALKAEVNSPFSFFEPYIINKGGEVVKEVEIPVINDETESTEQEEVENDTADQNEAEPESTETVSTVQNEPEPEPSDSKIKAQPSNNKQKKQCLGCLLNIAVLAILIMGVCYYLLSNNNKVKTVEPQKTATEEVVANTDTTAAIDTVADTLSIAMADTIKASDIAVDAENPVKAVESTVKKTESSTAKATEKMEASEKHVAEEIAVKHAVEGVGEIQLDSLGKLLTTVVSSGERLTLISLRCFGSKDFWPYIYMVNKDKLKSPNNVVTGSVLKLPNKEYFGIDSESEESLAKARQLGHNILRNQ